MAGHGTRNLAFPSILSVAIAMAGTAHAEQSPPLGPDPSSGEAGSARQAEDKKSEPSAEERLWSNLKGIPSGPLELDLGVSLRLRGELQENFDIKRYGDGSRDRFLLERFRLDFGLHFSENSRLFVQLQDAHELGCNFSNDEFENGSPYNNDLDLRQAFLEWTRIGGTPIGFKLGRQSIAFTDNRLMGPGEWGNVGRYSWDAAAFTWRSDPVDIDLFYAFRVQYDPTEFDDDHYDYDVLGVFSTFPLKKLNLHAFYFLKMNNFPPEDSESRVGSFHRHSPGISLEGTFENGVDLSMGAIPQFGSWGDRSVMALGGYAVLGYTAWLPWSPRIGLHYAYGSGDLDPADKTVRTFDGVFGAVDKYYGRMNLFAWMNLHDLQLSLSGSPSKSIEITADYHLFALAGRRDAWYYANGRPQRQDPSGDSGQVIGHEVDLVVAVKVTKHARLQAGYGVFVPGAFVRNTGPHGLAQWGFFQGSYAF